MLFFYPGTSARNPNHSFFSYRHANGKLDRLESELVLQSRGTFRYGGRAIISLEGEVRLGRPDGHSPGARGIFRATVGLGQGSGRVGWNMASSDQHLAAGRSAKRGTGLRGSPPPVPVVAVVPVVVVPMPPDERHVVVIVVVVVVVSILVPAVIQQDAMPRLGLGQHLRFG